MRGLQVLVLRRRDGTTSDEADSSKGLCEDEMNLKDCPFCGREDPEWVEEDRGENGSRHYVECPRCACRGPQSIIESKALHAWNKRVKLKTSWYRLLFSSQNKKGKHMAKDLSGLDAAGSALYDAAFADGVASVPTGATFTQATQDAAVAAQKAADIVAFKGLVSAEDADLQAKIAAL
jgi:Lar family restriction alleviation protein